MAPSHYLNQCWNIVNWTLRDELQWNFNLNANIFIEENTFQNVVCEMAAILSRPQCVNVEVPSEWNFGVKSQDNIDGSGQGCSISIAKTLHIPRCNTLVFYLLLYSFILGTVKQPHKDEKTGQPLTLEDVAARRLHVDNFCTACMVITVRCHYNAVNFITNIHKRHPMARP